jgi:DNA-binding protein YbaB
MQRPGPSLTACELHCRTEFDGYDEEETVKVIFMGNQTPKGIELTDDAAAAGTEELQKRITEAMADAHSKCAPPPPAR